MEAMDKKVAIIGAGELGMALHKVLVGHANVALWDVDSTKVPETSPLPIVLLNTELVLLAVPSFALRGAIGSCLPYMDVSKTPLISLAKGIESPSHKTMDQVLAEAVSAGGLWGVMGGPMLASELMSGKKCAAVAASPQESVCDMVRSVFADTNVAIETSRDARGVALAGALKNIYAVAMGIAAGLGWGEDETGWLASRSMEEMLVLGMKFGADELTIQGTAGFADFLATGYSRHSRNRAAGAAIARGESPVVTGEGILSLASVIQMLGNDVAGFPILSALGAITIKRQNAPIVFRELVATKMAAS